MPAFAGMSGLGNVPPHRQVLQSAKRPAGDPHRLTLIEPQALQPREHARQRHVGDHRARGYGSRQNSCASMEKCGAADMPQTGMSVSLAVGPAVYSQRLAKVVGCAEAKDGSCVARCQTLTASATGATSGSATA